MKYYIEKYGFNLLLIIVAATASILGRYFLLTSEPPTQIHHWADHIIRDATFTRMSVTGLPEDTLKSPEVRHYPDTNTLVFKQPHLITYTKQHNPPWHTKADFAKTTPAFNQVDLWRNVHIYQPAGNHNAKTEITTDQLTVLPHQKYAYTGSLAKLIQPGTMVNTKGFKAYIDEQRVELLSQVQGTYTPTATDEAS